MLKQTTTRTVVGAALLVATLVVVESWLGNDPRQKLTAQQADVAAIDPEAIEGAERLSGAFRAVAKRLRPSVVTITSSVEVSQRMANYDGMGLPPGLLPESMMEELLRQSGRDVPEESGPKRKVQTGIGSGVIVSGDGYVLTNNHVVQNADELMVEMSDGRVFTAELVGADDKSDVAVLKIDATGLIPAAIGDSARIEVGDWVVAIGSPFGLDQTVTAGIISATNRQTGIISGGYEDFLQTDAAINPGNSGGPLANLRGEIIGINTAINSRTGTNTGVGFAIPINMAARIMDDLRTEGRVVRGFIGASLDNVTAENASDFRLPDDVLRGVVITSVLEEGPADKAKLQEGDVVTAINGRPTNSLLQMRNQVALTRPGTTLSMNIYRNGRPQSVEITVGEQTAEKLSRLSGRAQIESLGLVAETMNDQWAKELELERGIEGALIVELASRGRGVALGLRAGDIIVSVDGRDVSSAAEVAELLDGKREFKLGIRRGSRTGTVSTFAD